MTAPIEVRALDACRKYVAAGAEIKRLTKAIGDTLDKCPGTGRQAETEESFRPTHLREWYVHGDRLGEWGFMGCGGPDYKADFKACPHCVLADSLIQERKAARQTYGAAKRFIGKIGKAK